MSRRTYEGPPLDMGWQYITERPELDDEDEHSTQTVYATEPEPPGTETTENVPIPGREERDRGDPDGDRGGQATLADFGGGVSA